MLLHLAVLITQRPDFSGFVIGINIRALQLLQPRAAIDKTARQRTRFEMTMLDHRRTNRAGTAWLYFWVIGMIAFHHWPAVIGAALDEIGRASCRERV